MFGFSTNQFSLWSLPAESFTSVQSLLSIIIITIISWLNHSHEYMYYYQHSSVLIIIITTISWIIHLSPHFNAVSDYSGLSKQSLKVIQRCAVNSLSHEPCSRWEMTNANNVNCHPLFEHSGACGFWNWEAGHNECWNHEAESIAK